MTNLFIYNYQYFWKKRKYDDWSSWFYTTGSMALGFTFNISSLILFYLLKTNQDLRLGFENPMYAIWLVPFVIIFIVIYFNGYLKKKVESARTTPMSQKWRIVFWIYYTFSIIIYSHLLSNYSSYLNNTVN